MNRTTYDRRLATDARYRVEFDLERGKVTGFVVQLEHGAGVDGPWVPVRRYDTAHGFAHRDRYLPDGMVFQHEEMDTQDFNEAMTSAIQEILAQWEEFVQPFREHQA